MEQIFIPNIAVYFDKTTKERDRKILLNILNHKLLSLGFKAYLYEFIDNNEVNAYITQNMLNDMHKIIYFANKPYYTKEEMVKLTNSAYNNADKAIVAASKLSNIFKYFNELHDYIIEDSNTFLPMPKDLNEIALIINNIFRVNTKRIAM